MREIVPLSLRRLGEWLLFGLLFAVLGFHIVRSAADLLLSSCPAHDTISEHGAAREACSDVER